MRDNYKILSVAPIILKVLAWVGIVLGVVSAGVIFLGADDSNTPRWMGSIALLAGAMYFFIFFVAAEFISLQFDIRDRIKV